MSRPSLNLWLFSIVLRTRTRRLETCATGRLESLPYITESLHAREEFASWLRAALSTSVAELERAGRVGKIASRRHDPRRLCASELAEVLVPGWAGKPCMRQRRTSRRAAPAHRQGRRGGESTGDQGLHAVEDTAGRASGCARWKWTFVEDERFGMAANRP